MKNKLIFIVLAASLLVLTRTAAAGSEGEYYFGLQYGVGNYDEEGISETYEPTLLTARLGRYLTPNFTIEGRIANGIDDDTHNLPEFGNRDATLELDSMFGICDRIAVLVDGGAVVGTVDETVCDGLRLQIRRKAGTQTWVRAGFGPTGTRAEGA